MKVEFTGHEESVQALAATVHDSGEVPERYIRPEIEADPPAADAGGHALPTIDMSRLLDPEFSVEESAKLGSACEHWGFFQLVNHAVDGGLLGQTKADVAEFFGLPLEEKSAVAIPPNGMQGFGHHFVFSKGAEAGLGRPAVPRHQARPGAELGPLAYQALHLQGHA
ncbi:hypothetical protein VPH35_008896 [Triticum aestivum]